MMTRWSTDACRRDPSIVSSNLTNPTFSVLSCSLGSEISWIIRDVALLMDQKIIGGMHSVIRF